MKVLITHSGLQHSYQLAWALEEAGHLAGFWSGVPVRDAQHSTQGLLRRLQPKLRVVPIAPFKRRHALLFPLIQRHVFGRLPSRWGNDLSHRLDHLYDWWVARRIVAFKPDVVVCYESAALRTFEAAKRVGAICVLDAASVHYAAQHKQMAALGCANSAWVDAYKQREIDLADAILTCSDLAASSYVAAGVPAEKMAAVPLGADLYTSVLPERVASVVVRFVFVGALRVIKGIDLLLDIFEQFQKEAMPVELTLIGGIAEGDLGAKARGLANVTLKPFMLHPAVFEEMARHDVLLLPSRFDSFGMVVPEAMAVGVPVLVTDRVGAKCIIEQHPDAGWIVPCEREAIRKKMLDIVANRGQLVSAAAAARRAAQDYQWSSYRRRVVATLERIYRLNHRTTRE